MKLLLFSDVHVNSYYCESLCQMAEDVDMVIGAGDFGALRRGINQAIDWLSGISKPSIVVPGNAESYHELQAACQQWPSARVLQGTSIEINGLIFFGIGGGIPVTPFGSWSYDFSEKQALKILKNCPANCILITHSPPYGLLDVSSTGRHLGSTSIRETVEQKTPRLVVCGHIHESSGKILSFGKSDIVNAGPMGMIYHLNPDA